MDRYERIFKKLDEILPLDEMLAEHRREGHAARKLVSDGFMDLHVDTLTLETSDNGFVWVVAIAHYYRVAGDSVPDPDMTIRVWPKLKQAEALTFQNSLFYQEVYPEPGKVYPKLKRDLNEFLEMWLRNIIEQGHKGLSGLVPEIKG